MKKKKIKILHVAQAAGGVDRYIRMLLKYLDKEKFENILVCSQDFREKDYKNLVDFFEQVKMDRAIGSNDLKAIGEVRRLIKRYNAKLRKIQLKCLIPLTCLSVEATKYGIRIGITAFIMLITKALRHVEYPMHRVWE